MKSYIFLLLGSMMLIFGACTGNKALTQEDIQSGNYQEVFGMLDVSEIEQKPDKLPMYPNGNVGVVNDIQKNVQYPASAKEAGMEGNVLVSFIVTKSGKVKNVQIEKSVHAELDKAAIEVIEELKPFTPAIINGEKSEVKLKSLITFRLPSEMPGKSRQ